MMAPRAVPASTRAVTRTLAFDPALAAVHAGWPVNSHC